MFKNFPLNRGSSSVVYKCFHLPTLKYVALKSVGIAEQDHRRQVYETVQFMSNCDLF